MYMWIGSVVHKLATRQSEGEGDVLCSRVSPQYCLINCSVSFKWTAICYVHVMLCTCWLEVLYIN